MSEDIPKQDTAASHPLEIKVGGRSLTQNLQSTVLQPDSKRVRLQTSQSEGQESILDQEKANEKEVIS